MSTTPENTNHSSTLTVIAEYSGEIVTDTKSETEILALTPVIKLPGSLPKVLVEKHPEVSEFMKARGGFLITEKQRKAIYEAIKNDKNLVNIKIRRLRSTNPNDPNAKLPERDLKDITELEKSLNLEFSVIIDQDREPIVLFRGKEFAIAKGKSGAEGKPGTIVKYGVRLSDGKFVAVRKIQSTLKFELAELKAQLEKMKLLLNVQNKIKSLPRKIATLEKQIKNKIIELAREQHLKETGIKIGRLVGQHIGQSERVKKTSVISYDVQVLMDGYHLGQVYHQSRQKEYNRLPSENLYLAVSLFEQLKEVHEINIIHGDIKPENIIQLIDSVPPKAKIIDPEIGSVLKKGESVEHFSPELWKGFVRGTWHYAAPEVKEKKELSFYSDVYSMGKVFVVMGFEQYLDPSLLLKYHVFLNSLLSHNPADRPSAAKAWEVISDLTKQNTELEKASGSLFMKIILLANDPDKLPILEQIMETGQYDNLKIDRNEILLYLLRARKDKTTTHLMSKYGSKYGVNFDVKDNVGKNILMYIFEGELDEAFNFITTNHYNEIIKFFLNNENLKLFIMNAQNKQMFFNKNADKILLELKNNNHINILDLIIGIAKDDPKFVFDNYLFIRNKIIQNAYDKSLDQAILLSAKAKNIRIPIEFIQCADRSIFVDDNVSILESKKTLEDISGLNVLQYYDFINTILGYYRNGVHNISDFDKMILNSVNYYMTENKEAGEKLLIKFLENGDTEPLIILLANNQLEQYRDFLMKLYQKYSDGEVEYETSPGFLLKLLGKNLKLESLLTLTHAPWLLKVKPNDFKTMLIEHPDVVFIFLNRFLRNLGKLKKEESLQFLSENIILMMDGLDKNAQDRSELIRFLFEQGMDKIIIELIKEKRFMHTEQDLDFVDTLLEEGDNINETMRKLFQNSDSASFLKEKGFMPDSDEESDSKNNEFDSNIQTSESESDAANVTPQNLSPTLDSLTSTLAKFPEEQAKEKQLSGSPNETVSQQQQASFIPGFEKSIKTDTKNHEKDKDKLKTNKPES